MPPKRARADQARQRFLAALQDGLDRSRITRPARLLIALSGGADSTALLLGLHELASSHDAKLEIEAAHFNHQLRGEGSKADGRFCRDLCDKLNVKLHSGTGDVAGHATKTGGSVEAAARDLRYRFLSQIASSHSIDAVATGHTADDQAETVLLALTRGAGLRGVSGMSYSTDRHDLAAGGNPLRVIRPMLEMRRSDTVKFCAVSGVTPCEDESNADLTYARNRMRHAVIPELQKINPAVVDAITRLAAITSEDVDLLDRLAKDALDEMPTDSIDGISKAGLRKLDPALLPHVIAEAYRRAAGSVRDLDMVVRQSAVDAVAELDSGSIDLPNSTTLVIDHDTVRFLAGDAEEGCPYPGSVGEHRLRLNRSVAFQDGSSLSARVVSPPPNLPSLTRWQAAINPDAVQSQHLTVRSRQNGDRFHALGMDGEMKLQDFFVNQHVPARWRDRVPLLIVEQGICWVVGERIAEWAKLPDQASEALLLEFRPSN